MLHCPLSIPIPMIICFTMLDNNSRGYESGTEGNWRVLHRNIGELIGVNLEWVKTSLRIQNITFLWDNDSFEYKWKETKILLNTIFDRKIATYISPL